jgi:hypothetical protein
MRAIILQFSHRISMSISDLGIDAKIDEREQDEGHNSDDKLLIPFCRVIADQPVECKCAVCYLIKRRERVV